jgi:hypothetical protein
MRRPALALAGALCAACSFAATTTTWELNGYQDFLRGRMEGLSLTRDGRLVLGPKLDTLFTADQPEIWSVARGPDAALYLGTGHRGRLYRVDSSGRGSLLWTASEPEIFAVAVDSRGVVYAGTSPDGKVYRIEQGKATEYFAPRSRYVWALALAPDGALFVGAGDPGRVFRVTAPGRGELYYETGQSHVTALAFDREGRLLAGSEPNGILYRIAAPQRAFVLYDANLPEIRAIASGADGAIYAAALGGSVARRAAAASSAGATSTTPPALPTVTTSITVTDQQGGLNPAPAPEAAKPAAFPSAATATSTTSTIEYTGVERSALYKIHPDNTVETLWSSKEENIYDLVLSGASILFLTDAQGRIYRLDADRKATLLAQANQGDATRLLISPDGLLAATGSLAKILRLGSSPASSGWFESPVHDAGTVARWGRLFWKGANTSRGVAFRTRTGNTARPDATWSDWSEPVSGAGGAAISSPNARYIQWRGEISAANLSLDSVTLAYLPQNTPPVVRSITVTGKSSGSSSPAVSTAPSSAAAYSITVTDTGPAAPAAGTSAQAVARGAGQQIQVAWQADDPDGDRLLFSLYFRGEDESQWKLLRAGMPENAYLLEADVFADGRYYFRVIATDRPSNPAESAREAELVSAPVLFDNTPPAVTPAAPRRSGAALEIEVEAEDRGSVLRRCEYSVDAGPWMPVEAADGVTDSPRERFQLRLDAFPQGEHLVVIRVYDANGNAGLAKVVVR